MTSDYALQRMVYTFAPRDDYAKLRDSYLLAVRDLPSELCVRACEELEATWKEMRRPRPADVRAVAEQLRELEKQREAPSISEDRATDFAAVHSEITSGERRWYVENVINPPRDENGARLIECPDDWAISQSEADCEAWERKWSPTREVLRKLFETAPDMAEATSGVVE